MWLESIAVSQYPVMNSYHAVIETRDISVPCNTMVRLEIGLKMSCCLREELADLKLHEELASVSSTEPHHTERYSLLLVYSSAITVKKDFLM